MTKEEKVALIRAYISTPEGLADLARRMESPKRCGGLDYKAAT